MDIEFKDDEVENQWLIFLTTGMMMSSTGVIVATLNSSSGSLIESLPGILLGLGGALFGILAVFKAVSQESESEEN